MSHLKRQKIPKSWPIPRKGTKYVVRPSLNPEKGVPILIILRDILKIAQNRKEVKKALNSKNILLNNKIVKDEKINALLLDVIGVIPSKKYYKVELSENGKFAINEIKESESKHKISKIINKRTLKGKKTQLNLSDGRNVLSKIVCEVNDSVLINFDKNKIEKCISMKEKSKAIVFSGKHSGKYGIIDKINKERKMAELKTDKEIINVLIKQIMVVE